MKNQKEEQNYEKYWKLTLEYSDIYGENFNYCLSTIVNFIDETKNEVFSEDKYKRLQEILGIIFKKVDKASTRKSINQFVKLGFIYPKLEGYPEETKNFIKAKNEENKRIIFSRIVYNYSSFNSSVTEVSKGREINFLIKTLENISFLDKQRLSVLMQVDTTKNERGYITEKELEKGFEEAKTFYERKYNQIRFLWGVLKKLDGIVERNELLILAQEENILDEEVVKVEKKRDNYLQTLYKRSLKQEAKDIMGEVGCMVSKLPYDKLIASHIKPFRYSMSSEEYVSNNGLLLSLDLDQLFDFGKISFDDNGKIIYSKELNKKIINHIEKNEWSLIPEFLNSERLEYLEYHRKNILK